MRERTCERCGKANPRPKAPHCVRCKKSLENAKYRGTVAPEPFDTFDCAWCGKHCTRGVDVVAHASRFCCKAHKAAWHKVHVEGPKGRQQTKRQARWARAEKKLAKALSGTATRTWTAGQCVACPRLFVGSGTQAISCSEECHHRYQKRRARAARRAKYGHETNRKRARRHGVEYEAVDRLKVFERDGYRCQICKKLTDRKAKANTPRYPTIDHIIPMACGGDHLYTNVQCACHECNWRKSDGAANDQLLLLPA